jgi:hypothetical protein
MNAKLYVGSLAAAIWIAAVIGKHFWPDLAIDAIVNACGMVLAGLGAYHMGGNAAVPEITVTAPPPAKEGGFASIRALLLLAAISLTLCFATGCAGLNVSWVATASYNTPATTSATLTPGKSVLQDLVK